MTCVFCQKEETCWHGSMKAVDKLGPEVDFYICSRCVQRLLHLSQDQLKAAYDMAINKGFTNKADTLKFFMEAEHDPISTFSRVTEPKRSARVSRYHKAAVGRTQTPRASIR